MVFLQVAAPSRGTLPAYRQLHEECLGFVAEINERYGRDGYQPIILLDEHHDQDAAIRRSIAPPISAWSPACTTA